MSCNKCKSAKAAKIIKDAGLMEKVVSGEWTQKDIEDYVSTHESLWEKIKGFGQRFLFFVALIPIMFVVGFILIWMLLIAVLTGREIRLTFPKFLKKG